MRQLIPILLLIAAAFSGRAQQFHFKQYSLAEGLSRSGVYDILQDKHGFLWVATEGGGLCKFDGQKFTTYTRSNGLGSEKVRTIFEDRQGLLWLGTTNGLSYFDGQKFKTLTTEDGISDNFIRSIGQDAEGNLWIGSNRGITIIDTKEKGVSNKLKTNFSLPHKKVRSLLAQGDKMWIGTDNGLARHATNKIELFTTENGLTSNVILSLFLDADQQLWVGTENGLNQIDQNGVVKSWTTADGLIAARVRSITQDYLGNIWIGTSEGISVFNGTSFLNITAANGLVNERIRCITTDKFNNVWIGTYFGGIMRFNHQDFISYSPSEGLISNQIFAITEDREGDLILGTFDGVSKLNVNNNNQLKKYQNLTRFQGLLDNAVKAVHKDTNGYYWYGSARGISILKNGYQKQITKADGLIESSVTRIREIDGAFWIGTMNGLAKIETADYKTFKVGFLTDDDGLAGKEVSEIMSDADGNVWVSFSDGLISVFKDDILFSPSLPSGVAEITAMQIDSAGRYWLGTNGSGIFYGKYLKKERALKLDNISTDTELTSNYIFSLLIKDNNVWVGLENGLDLIANINDSILEIQNFGPERGFFGLQNNQNASFADSRGNLWFGTVNGLFCLRENVLENFTEGKPSVNYIQSLKVNGETINWKKSEWCNGLDSLHNLPKNLYLPYDKNNISFEFIALNYISPNNIKYSWKLEGFDYNWKSKTTNNYTTYTNLYPGDYSFKLRSSNEHGLITGEPIVFNFTIEKPWWSTWVFRVIAALLALAFLVLIINFRTRQLRKKQRSLERTILERTTEITHQKEQLEYKNNEITDSIKYSRRIQQSILPSAEKLGNTLTDYFIFYKPKDIVSGDFYWTERASNNPDQIFISVADCTGHGVPGAMVSLVGTRALNSSVREHRLLTTSEILNTTNEIVLEAFTDMETGTVIKDGMDLALCSIDYADPTAISFQFSGAHNPIWIVRHENQGNLVINDDALLPNFSLNNYHLYEIKGNKQPIGYFENQTGFKQFNGILQKGDRIYMTSDGYADQFGGERGKKFKYKPLKSLLLSVQDSNLTDQKNKIKKAFFDWKGELEQIDDVCMIAIEI